MPKLHLTFDIGTNENIVLHDALLQGTYQPAQEPERRCGITREALMFDGYSTKVTLEHFMPDGGDMALCLWVAPRAFPARGDAEKVIAAQYQALRFARSGFSLGIAAFGQITYRIAVRDSSGRSALYAETLSLERYPTLIAGEWNHLAFIFSQTEAQVRIFLNGQRIYTQDFPDGSRFLPCEGQALTLGDDPAAGKLHGVYSFGAFSGLMDEVYWYDSVLSDAEVRKLAAVTAESPADISYNRSRLAQDRYRPAYHVQGGQMWMNEAIAPFYYQGKYHLFYQTNLSGPYYRQASWGHMISSDLMHWDDLPPALTAQYNDIDPDACFSGNAALDEHGIPHLFYTGVRLGGKILNRVTSATPADESLTKWEKSQTVLIDHPNDCSPTDFRDPFIFDEGNWSYMLIASTTKGAASGNGDDAPLVVIYRALKGRYDDWERLGTLLKGDNQRWPESGSCWECPVFFRLTDETGGVSKYFLAVSVTGSNISVYYWLGEFDPETGAFIPDVSQPTRLDNGMINLVGASTGFIDPQTGNSLITSTINDGRSEQERYNAGWSGFNTLWRSLSLKRDGTLMITPMERYETLHAALLCDVEKQPLTLANQQLVPFDRGAHVKLAFKADESITLNIGGDCERRLRLSYDGTKRLLTMDTTHSVPEGNPMRGIAKGSIPWEQSGLVNLDIYIDRCAVEVYANNGLCMTGILLSDDRIVSLSFSGIKTAEIEKLSVWQMP